VQPLLQLVLESATGRLSLCCPGCGEVTTTAADRGPDRAGLVAASVAAFVAAHAPCAWPEPPTGAPSPGRR
jgi:hypothetical protein